MFVLIVKDSSGQWLVMETEIKDATLAKQTQRAREKSFFYGPKYIAKVEIVEIEAGSREVFSSNPKEDFLERVRQEFKESEMQLNVVELSNR